MDEEVFSPRTGNTHIVVLRQGGHGARDRLQGKEHIGGFLDNFYGHPDSRVCRLSHRVHPLNSGVIAGCATCIVECRADGESDGGR